MRKVLEIACIIAWIVALHLAAEGALWMTGLLEEEPTLTAKEELLIQRIQLEMQLDVLKKIERCQRAREEQLLVKRQIKC